jgi:hypothetical protein
MKPHPDPHYYDCSHPDRHGKKTCAGKMEFFAYDRKKEAVYKCPVPTCGRKAVALHVKPDKMPELKRETFTA